MYRVLIVEDEMLVRNGIKNSINWKKFDMEVIADVSDGKAALDIYEKEKPEVVLTDIKMPIMDGMELISRIRKNDNATRIIILSCLEDFNMARRAMNLGVTGYILKLTMSFEEMESELSKAKEELMQLKIEKKSMLKQTGDEEFLKENLFKNYLYNAIYHEEEFGKLAEVYKCRLKPSRLTMAIIEIDEYNKLKSTFDDEKGWLVRFSLLNVINEILESYNRGEVFQESDSRFVLIFSFYDLLSESKANEELNKILEHLIRVFRSFFNVQVSFGVSSTKSGYKGLSEAYGEASLAIGLRFFAERNVIIHWNKEMQHQLFGHATSEIKDLLKKLGDTGFFDESSLRKIEEMIHKELTSAITGKNQILNCFHSLIHLIPCLLNLTDAVSSATTISFIEEIDETYTLKQALDILYKYVIQMGDLRIKGRTLSKEVADAVKFIKQHYDRNISLKQVAQQVSLSPNYLSSLFKKELDVNFIDYLNHIRITKAKALLKETDIKSYEISEKTGFSHDSYFNRIFKKTTGMTPNEYRKQLFINVLEE